MISQRTGGKGANLAPYRVAKPDYIKGGAKTMHETETNENQRHIEAIRDDLEAIYEGRVWRLEDGEEITLEDGEELTEEQEQGAEAVTFWDYFADALDIIYYTRGREGGDILGARVMVACGGPNIFVDTYRNTIELYWWSDHAECELWHEVADAITETLNEVYYC